jgi:hypothetical protein
MMNYVQAWHSLLSQWNDDVFEHLAKKKASDLTVLDMELLERGTFFLKPAKHTEIVECERRLGVTLSDCVRSFYEVTNGWWICGHYAEDFPIYSVQQMCYLGDNFPKWKFEQLQSMPDATDLEYRDYEEWPFLRPRDCATAIALTPMADAASIILNTRFSILEGEWDALEDYPQVPDFVRRPNFFGLMEKISHRVVSSILKRTS